ncbi:MAG: sugar phosphate isomerase/epimerase [Thaumarchaeota archaeon]|nr:sugar phosphate isomerase/epimerase [Nitrososphaerota archaeon]
MKVGLSTWSLLEQDVYSAVKKIGDAGSEYVELWGEVPHAYPDLVDRMRLKDVLSTYGMVVTTHAPFTDLNLASPFQPVKGAVERTLEGCVKFSEFLGAKMVTFHPGSVHNAALVPQAAESAASSLRKMMEASGGAMSINVENQSKSNSKYHYPVGSTFESLTRVLSSVPGSRCTLDVGHAYASGLDPSECLGGLGGRLAEVHVSDNAGSADDHLIPGHGTAPLGKLMEEMRERDVLVCLELNPHRYGPDQILDAFRQAKSGRL